MRWVTRAHPIIARIACPWLIARFIDEEAIFLYVAADRVLPLAERTGAIPYDVPGAKLGPASGRSSFDTFLSVYGLDDPALLYIAHIVRSEDASCVDRAPQSAELLAMSRSLAQSARSDHEMLRYGMVMYDALYAWSHSVRSGAGGR